MPMKIWMNRSSGSKEQIWANRTGRINLSYSWKTTWLTSLMNISLKRCLSQPLKNFRTYSLNWKGTISLLFTRGRR